jgi:hypothetical protein
MYVNAYVQVYATYIHTYIHIRTKNMMQVWVMEISNPATHNAETPEVFYSGTIHGNERVGPTAVVEFAEMLLT